MAKNDNLNDYLADLYLGIRSKNQNASKNPQNFRSEIENIETADSIPEWDPTDFTREGEPIPPKTAEEIVVTPSTKVQEFTPTDTTYISKVTVEAISDTSVKFPDYTFFMKEKLDFSIMPSDKLGYVHYCRFDLSDTDSNEIYIGLHINDGELKAIRYNDFSNPLTIYDANGWANVNYHSIHIGKAVFAREFVAFMSGNSTTKISFTIGSASLMAEKEMVWSDFIPTSYNTENVEVSGGSVKIGGSPSDYYILDSTGLPVLKTTKIADGGVYTAGSYSGSLISFTVNGTTYYAVEGWSWATWVANTNYNPDGYKVASGTNLVTTSNGTTVKTSSSTTVSAGSSITAGHAYKT